MRPFANKAGNDSMYMLLLNHKQDQYFWAFSFSNLDNPPCDNTCSEHIFFGFYSGGGRGALSISGARCGERQDGQSDNQFLVIYFLCAIFM